MVDQMTSFRGSGRRLEAVPRFLAPNTLVAATVEVYPCSDVVLESCYYGASAACGVVRQIAKIDSTETKCLRLPRRMR